MKERFQVKRESERAMMKHSEEVQSPSPFGTTSRQQPKEDVHSHNLTAPAKARYASVKKADKVAMHFK